MVSAVGHDPKTLEEFRQAQQDKKFKFSPSQHTLQFVASLLEVFGQRYAASIRKQLGQKAQGSFDQVWRAFDEIQKKLEESGSDLGELKRGKEVSQVLRECRSERVQEDWFFSKLREKSYGILAFPQKIFLRYKSVDSEEVARIEGVRRKAFGALNRCLKMETPEELKGDAPPSPPKPLSLEEEMGVTKLYFSGGALYYKDQPLYFSDMIGMWTEFNPSWGEKLEQLLSQLTARGWVQDTKVKIIPLFARHRGLSFKRFLIECSIDAIGENLNLKFSDFVRKDIAERFECEEVRSDLCYFTADPSRFYELKLPPDRASGSLARAFQLFWFVNRRYGTLHKPEEKNAFLSILFFISSSWKESSFPEFYQRRWIEEMLLSGDKVDAFDFAWKGLKSILENISTENKEKFYKDHRCWEVLFFLWKNPKRDAFITVILRLSKLPHFSMNLGSILSFCRENESNLTMENGDFFVRQYEATIAALQKGGKEIQNPQYIFFEEPPLKILPNLTYRLEVAPANAESFVHGMKPYAFSKEREYCLMLRQHILCPDDLMFELLWDIEAIGGHISEALLWDVLSKEQEGFTPKWGALLQQEEAPPRPVPSPDTVAAAKAVSRNIQVAYQFSEVQIFSLYLEFIRLLMRGKGDLINKISGVIAELVWLCPSLRKEDVYFLFRYHPDISPADVAKLAEMREAWAKSERELNKFIIDQGRYQGIIKQIESFVEPLSKACPDDVLAGKFNSTCQRSLLSAFFPPLQPLTDYFRITNVTAEGIRWGQQEWSTHLGQLKFILGEANVGIYFNWAVIKDRPVLFISFFNAKTKEAHSSFIPIQVSVQQIASEESRVAFYSLLSVVSNLVLREEADMELPVDAPDTPESWASCFIGIEQVINNFKTGIKEEHINQIWIFLKKVKIAYRTLFLSSVAKRRLPDPASYEPKAVAALGHISSFHRRGSLLSKSIFEIEPQKECYLPDAAEEVVDTYRTLFATSTKGIRPLDLSLKMPNKESIEVSYRVQTIEELADDSLERTLRNEIAYRLLDGRYVTLTARGIPVPLRYPPQALNDPELFRTYFDYHNLILKAALLN